MLMLRHSSPQAEERASVVRAARAEVDQALRLDPSNLLGLIVMGELQPSQRRELAERAVAAHGDRVEAWLMQAMALTESGGAKQEEAFKNAIRLDATNVSAMKGLSFLYAQQKSYLRALPLVKNAVRLAPRDPAAWDIYAMVAFGLRNCNEAVSAEHRAIEALHGSSRHKPYEDNLSRYRKACSEHSGTAETSSQPE
jgi:cytochrome c-type biogenesis protein CcmH/NrfG